MSYCNSRLKPTIYELKADFSDNELKKNSDKIILNDTDTPFIRDRNYLILLKRLTVTWAQLKEFDVLNTDRNFKLMIIKKFLASEFDNLSDEQKKKFTDYMCEKYPEIKSLLMLI